MEVIQPNQFSLQINLVGELKISDRLSPVWYVFIGKFSVMEETLQILVVDDDVTERTAVCQSLLATGEVVCLREASDCGSAIALLQDHSFDCIFLDNSLPVAEILTLFNNLLAIDVKLPVVMLLSQEESEVRAEIAARVSGCLSKANIFDWFNKKLAYLIQLYRTEREAAIRQEKLQLCEENYRLILEVSQDAIWNWDIENDKVFWSKRLQEIVVSPEDENLNQLNLPELGCSWDNFLQLFHAEDRDKLRGAIALHWEQNAELNVEVRLGQHAGKNRYCVVRGKVQRNVAGAAVRMIATIADITAQKQVNEELSRKSLQLQIFHQINDAVSQVSTAEEIFPAICGYLKVGINVDRLVALVLDNRGEMRCHSNWLSLDLKQSLESHSFWFTDTKNPAPIYVADVAAEIQAKERQNYGNRWKQGFDLLLANFLSAGVRALGFIPLMVQQKTLGCLIFCYDKQRQFDREEKQLAAIIAERIAFAILSKNQEENFTQISQYLPTLNESNVGERLKRAIATLGQKQQQLRTLQRLTNLLNQRLTKLPNLLQVMVQLICNAVPKAQFSLIMLHNSQCSRLVLTVTAGISTEKLRLEDAFGRGEGWLAKVASTGISHPIQGRSDLPASVYAVPIESAQAGRLGLLAIGNWDDVGAFTQEDRDLLVAVGEQAAIAINNARIIKMLEEREDRLAYQNEILARQNRELESQREQIELQNLQLLEAAKLKSHFLATVSHELRTPMNAVIGFSQLLLRQLRGDRQPQSASLSGEQLNMLERILKNGKHLLDLINDLIDISKIEAGRMELEREEINLESLVINCMEEMLDLAEEKHLDLQTIVNLSNPILINDRDRLQKILMNLLSNAIKFTYAGSVRVEVFEVELNRIAIRVTDTGIGIAEENVERIFDQFWQVDQSTTKVHYGTGLGLAIIKSLVQLMKGTVKVETKLGEGSAFQVEIPRELPPCSHESIKKVSRKLLK